MLVLARSDLFFVKSLLFVARSDVLLIKSVIFVSCKNMSHVNPVILYLVADLFICPLLLIQSTYMQFYFSICNMYQLACKDSKDVSR